MTETILNEFEELLKSKPDSLIVHARTNGIAKGRNVLTNAKKILKKVKKSSQETKAVFSGLLFEKIKRTFIKIKLTQMAD